MLRFQSGRRTDQSHHALKHGSRRTAARCFVSSRVEPALVFLYPQVRGYSNPQGAIVAYSHVQLPRMSLFIHSILRSNNFLMRWSQRSSSSWRERLTLSESRAEWRRNEVGGRMSRASSIGLGVACVRWRPRALKQSSISETTDSIHAGRADGWRYRFLLR